MLKKTVIVFATFTTLIDIKIINAHEMEPNLETKSHCEKIYEAALILFHELYFMKPSNADNDSAGYIRHEDVRQTHFHAAAIKSFCVQVRQHQIEEEKRTVLEQQFLPNHYPPGHVNQN